MILNANTVPSSLRATTRDLSEVKHRDVMLKKQSRMIRGAARIFLRGGLKLWKQKPWKGKIAC